MLHLLTPGFPNFPAPQPRAEQQALVKFLEEDETQIQSSEAPAGLEDPTELPAAQKPGSRPTAQAPGSYEVLTKTTKITCDFQKGYPHEHVTTCRAYFGF